MEQPVDPPKFVTVGSPLASTHPGLLLAWRRVNRRGIDVWEGLVVHVVTYKSQEGSEYSVRVEWQRSASIQPMAGDSPRQLSAGTDSAPSGPN